MTKLDFLLKLHETLRDLPQDEVKERLRFYNEMIEDRMEDGLSEEEAVSDVGTVEEVAEQIRSELPQMKDIGGKAGPEKRMRGWKTLLLAVGSPLWFPLLVAALAVVLSLYISLWAVVISLWAVWVSLLAGGLTGLLTGIMYAILGNSLPGIALLGCSSVCVGLAILLFYCCRAATKGTAMLLKAAAVLMKKRSIRKEED